MPLSLLRFWAFEIDTMSRSLPQGGEQVLSSTWAAKFIGHYEEAEWTRCLDVKFKAYPPNEASEAVPNPVYQHIRQACFPATDRDEENAIQFLVQKLASVVDRRTPRFLNVLTVFADNASNGKKFVTWSFPSNDALRMSHDGVLTEMKNVFVQKKFLRKAGYFDIQDTDINLGDIRIFDRGAQYEAVGSASYWMDKYLECVPSLTGPIASKALVKGLSELMVKNSNDAVSILQIQAKIEEFKAENSISSLKKIIDSLPSRLGDELNQRLDSSLSREAEFVLEADQFKNFFKYEVHRTGDDISIVLPVDGDHSAKVSEADGGGRTIEAPKTLIAETRYRQKGV